MTQRKDDMSESQLTRRVEADAPLANVTADVPIGAILNHAVERGMDPASLEKLVALYERVSDRNAAKEFAEAMAAFQAECPPIPKTSSAKITMKSGGQYSYKYAELDAIVGVIRPLLSKHGLSYTWDSAEDSGKITCTCMIRHVNGHSVSAKFQCPVDSAAAMSGAQKSAAALTYARRQSLIQALGLTTCDPDTDAGATARITDNQAANLEALMSEVGADRPRFLRYLGVESLADLPASEFTAAVSALEAKRKAGTK